MQIKFRMTKEKRSLIEKKTKQMPNVPSRKTAQLSAMTGCEK